MTLKRIDSIIQSFNGTKDIWNGVNTIVPKGMLVYAIDTKELKLGDGYKSFVQLPVFLNLNDAYDRFINQQVLNVFENPTAEDEGKIVFINTEEKYAYGEITIDELISRLTAIESSNDTQDSLILTAQDKFSLILDSLSDMDNKLVKGSSNKFIPDEDIETYKNDVIENAVSNLSLSLNSIEIYKDSEFHTKTTYMIPNTIYYAKINAFDSENNTITYDLKVLDENLENIDYVNISELTNPSEYTITVDAAVPSAINAVKIKATVDNGYGTKNKIIDFSIVDPESTLNGIVVKAYTSLDDVQNDTNDIPFLEIKELSEYYFKIFTSDDYYSSIYYDFVVVEETNPFTITTESKNIFKVVIDDIDGNSDFNLIAKAKNPDMATYDTLNLQVRVLDMTGGLIFNEATGIRIYKSLDDANSDTNPYNGDLRDYSTYYIKLYANDLNVDDSSLSYQVLWEHTDSNDTTVADISILPDSFVVNNNTFEVTINEINASFDITFVCSVSNGFTTIDHSVSRTINSSTESLSIDVANTNFYDTPACDGQPLTYLLSNTTVYIKVIANDINENPIYGYTATLPSGETRIDPIVFNGNIGTVVLHDTFDSDQDNYQFTLGCRTDYAIVDNVIKEIDIKSTSSSTTIGSISFYKSYNSGTKEVSDVIEPDETLGICKLFERLTYYAKIPISDSVLDIADFIVSMTTTDTNDSSKFVFTTKGINTNDKYAIVQINVVTDEIVSDETINLTVTVDNNYSSKSKTVDIYATDVDDSLTSSGSGLFTYTNNTVGSEITTGEVTDVSDDIVVGIQFTEKNDLPCTFNLTIPNNDGSITVGSDFTTGDYHYWVLQINPRDNDSDLLSLNMEVNNTFTTVTQTETLTIIDKSGSLSFDDPAITIHYVSDDSEVVGDLIDNKSNYYYAKIHATDAHGFTINYSISVGNNDVIDSFSQDETHPEIFKFNTKDITGNNTVNFTATIDNGTSPITSQPLSKNVYDASGGLTLSYTVKEAVSGDDAKVENDRYFLNENTSYKIAVTGVDASGYTINYPDDGLTLVTSGGVLPSITKDVPGDTTDGNYTVTVPAGLTDNRDISFHITVKSFSGTTEIASKTETILARDIDVDGGISFTQELVPQFFTLNDDPVSGDLIDNKTYKVVSHATDINYPENLEYRFTVTTGGSFCHLNNTGWSSSNERQITIDDITANDNIEIKVEIKNDFITSNFKSSTASKAVIDSAGYINDHITLTLMKAESGFPVTSLNDISSTAYLKIEIDDPYGTPNIDSIVSSDSAKVSIGTEQSNNTVSNLTTIIYDLTIAEMTANSTLSSIVVTISDDAGNSSIVKSLTDIQLIDIEPYIVLSNFRIYDSLANAQTDDGSTGLLNSNLIGNTTYYVKMNTSMSGATSFELNVCGLVKGTDTDNCISSISLVNGEVDIFEMVIGTVPGTSSPTVIPSITVNDVDIPTHTKTKTLAARTLNLISSLDGLIIDSFTFSNSYDSGSKSLGAPVDHFPDGDNVYRYVAIEAHDTNDNPFNFGNTFGSDDASGFTEDSTSYLTDIAFIESKTETNSDGHDRIIGFFKFKVADLTNGDVTPSLIGTVSNSGGSITSTSSIDLWDMNYNFPTPVVKIYKDSAFTNEVTGDLFDDTTHNTPNDGYYIKAELAATPHSVALNYTLTITQNNTSVTVDDPLVNQNGEWKIHISNITQNEQISISINVENTTYNISETSSTDTRTILDVSGGLSVNSGILYDTRDSETGDYSGTQITVNNGVQKSLAEDNTFYLQLNIVNSANTTVTFEGLEYSGISSNDFNVVQDNNQIDKFIVTISEVTGADISGSVLFHYSNDGGNTIKTFKLSVDIPDLEGGITLTNFSINYGTISSIGNPVSNNNIFDDMDNIVASITVNDANPGLTGGINNITCICNSSHVTYQTKNSSNYQFSLSDITTNEALTFTITVTTVSGVSKVFTNSNFTLVDSLGAIHITNKKIFNTDSNDAKADEVIPQSNVYHLTDKRLNDNDVLNKIILEATITDDYNRNIEITINYNTSLASNATNANQYQLPTSNYSSLISLNDVASGTNSDVFALLVKVGNSIKEIDFSVEVIDTFGTITFTSASLLDGTTPIADNGDIYNTIDYTLAVDINDTYGAGLKYTSVVYNWPNHQRTITENNNPENFTIPGSFLDDMFGTADENALYFHGTINVIIRNAFGELIVNNTILNEIIAHVASVNFITINISPFYSDQACTTVYDDGSGNLIGGRVYYVKIDAVDNYGHDITDYNVTQNGGTISSDHLDINDTATPSIKQIVIHDNVSDGATIHLQVAITTSSGGHKTGYITDIRTIDSPYNTSTINSVVWYDNIGGNVIDKDWLLDDTTKLASGAYFVKINATDTHNLSIKYYFPLGDIIVNNLTGDNGASYERVDGSGNSTNDETSPWFKVVLDGNTLGSNEAYGFTSNNINNSIYITNEITGNNVVDWINSYSITFYNVLNCVSIGGFTITSSTTGPDTVFMENNTVDVEMIVSCSPSDLFSHLPSAPMYSIDIVSETDQYSQSIDILNNSDFDPQASPIFTNVTPLNLTVPRDYGIIEMKCIVNLGIYGNIYRDYSDVRSVNLDHDLHTISLKFYTDEACTNEVTKFIENNTYYGKVNAYIGYDPSNGLTDFSLDYISITDSEGHTYATKVSGHPEIFIITIPEFSASGNNAYKNVTYTAHVNLLST